MRTIYVFGNPLVKEDSLALKLLGRLRRKFPDLDFKEFDTTEDLEPEMEISIIDAVKGIKEIELIDDVDRIASDKIYSMHDFDLGYNLKLMKEMGMIKKVKIFGIPIGIAKEKAFTGLARLIEKEVRSSSL
jgi:Ni,Fe-hydrogenase maturation factor